MATETAERNKELIRRAFEQSPISGSPGGVLMPDPYSVTCVFHGAAELFRGTTPSRDYMQAFPDLRLTIEDMVAESDRVVTHLTGRGTHTGEFRGVPPSSKEVGIRVIVISRLRDGQIVEEWGTLSWE